MKNYKIIIILACLLFIGMIPILFAQESSQKPRVRVKNRKIYVDGKEFFIKGAAYALNYPKVKHYSQIPKEVIEKDFQLMEEAGINTIRTYRLLPDFILDLSERHNIMVIENVVYPGDWTDFNSAIELERLKSIAVRNVERHKDRKCILAWDIWNDAPFTFGKQGDSIRRYGEEKVNAFFKEIYKAIKEVDPYHPITGSNLTYREESINLGAGFLDILAYNVYVGIYDWLDGKFSYENAKETAQKFKEISLKYNKPVIIAETGYSSCLEASTQGEAIQGQVKAVEDNLAGIIIFEWADEWDKAGDPSRQNNHIEEHWGIVDGYRKPKDGYYKLKELYPPINDK